MIVKQRMTVTVVICWQITIALAIFIFSLTTARAASFDCTKAKTFVESTICSSQELSLLDDQLGLLYKEATKTTDNKAALISDQRNWLKLREKCKDHNCLKAAFTNRIEYLKGVTSPSQTATAPQEPRQGARTTTTGSHAVAQPPTTMQDSKQASHLGSTGSFDGVWVGKAEIGEGRPVKGEHIIRIVINERRGEYEVIYLEPDDVRSNCYSSLSPEKKDGSAITFGRDGRCHYENIVLTMLSKENLAYSSTKIGFVTARISANLSRDKDVDVDAQASSLDTKDNGEFSDIDVQFCNIRKTYYEWDNERKATYTVDSLYMTVPKNVDLLNEATAKRLVAMGFGEARKRCGPKSERVDICILDQPLGTINHCLVNGTLSKTGIEEFSNRGAIEVAEADRKKVQAQMQEQMQAQIKEQAEKKKVKKIMDFLKDTQADAYVRVPKLTANPFVYEGKVVVVAADLRNMLNRSEAIFGCGDCEFGGPVFIVSDIPTTRITNTDTVLLAGLVMGNKTWKTPAGGEVALAHLKFVDSFELQGDIRLHRQDALKEFFCRQQAPNPLSDVECK